MTAPVFTVLIPARMASTRLPNKPLADLEGLPMVVRVAQRALLSRAQRAVVAADDVRIVNQILSASIAGNTIATCGEWSSVTVERCARPVPFRYPSTSFQARVLIEVRLTWPIVGRACERKQQSTEERADTRHEITRAIPTGEVVQCAE